MSAVGFLAWTEMRHRSAARTPPAVVMRAERPGPKGQERA
jgi:hypothetical protein